jgi:two-component system invasion response regulator UvrY
MNKKQIIVIDDEPLISTLMKELIEDDQEFEIAKITTEKEEFLKACTEHKYDVALIDISVGWREGGLEILQILQEKGIDTPCIVLSAHEEIDYASRCLKLGALGYLNKNYICTDLIAALKAVSSRELFVSGNNSRYILEKFKQESVR